jgi:hypothetical protein
MFDQLQQTIRGKPNCGITPTNISIYLFIFFFCSNLLEIGGVQFLFLLPTPENENDGENEIDEDDDMDDEDSYYGQNYRSRARSGKRSRTSNKSFRGDDASRSKRSRLGPTGSSPPPLDSLVPAVIPEDFMRRRSVDYSADEMKDVKPPYSYATLIAEAINSCPIKAMSLSEIYQFIADQYAFFRHATHSWQNSVRHNLSLNRAFQKVARPSNISGKGCLWRIDPDHAHELTDEPKRPKRRASELYGLDENGNSAAVQAIQNAMQNQFHPDMFPYGPMYPPYHPMYSGGGSMGMSGAYGMPPMPHPSLETFFNLQNGTQMNSTDERGDAGDGGALPVHAVSRPYRSYYSLYHTTPDLTLLPTPAGLMRSLPKLFKIAHVMDQPPTPDSPELLIGDFLDRAAFPKIGFELNLTKEQLKTSSTASIASANQLNSSIIAAVSAANAAQQMEDKSVSESGPAYGFSTISQLPVQASRHGPTSATASAMKSRADPSNSLDSSTLKSPTLRPNANMGTALRSSPRKSAVHPFTVKTEGISKPDTTPSSGKSSDGTARPKAATSKPSLPLQPPMMPPTYSYGATSMPYMYGGYRPPMYGHSPYMYPGSSPGFGGAFGVAGYYARMYAQQQLLGNASGAPRPPYPSGVATPPPQKDVPEKAPLPSKPKPASDSN